jgi:uncharacterized SAM-dependent methyltransferase
LDQIHPYLPNEVEMIMIRIFLLGKIYISTENLDLNMILKMRSTQNNFEKNEGESFLVPIIHHNNFGDFLKMIDHHNKNSKELWNEYENCAKTVLKILQV